MREFSYAERYKWLRLNLGKSRAITLPFGDLGDYPNGIDLDDKIDEAMREEIRQAGLGPVDESRK